MYIPASLFIYTGDGRTRTDGNYTFAGEVNNLPFWVNDKGDRWLYSSPKGLWTITDDTKHFSTGWGYVVSSRNEGAMPSMLKKWKGAVGDRWEPLPDMVVSDSSQVPKEQPTETATPEDLVSQAIAEEEAAANSEVFDPQQNIANSLMLLSTPSKVLDSLHSKVASERASNTSLELRRDHMAKMVESKDQCVRKLEEALVQERHRASAAEQSRSPLVEQSQLWRAAAHELDTVKIQMEGELQEVRQLATHRLREKDRVISELQSEAVDIKAAVDTVTKELEKAKEEVKVAKEREKEKEGKVRELENMLAQITTDITNQERLFGQKEYRRNTLEETRMSDVMNTLHNEIWDTLAPTPDEPRPEAVEDVHSCITHTYELDDELPPSPVSRPGWPSHNAVVASLAEIIREQRLS